MSRDAFLLVLVPTLPLLLALLSALVRRPLWLLPWGALPALACILLVPVGAAFELPDAQLSAVLRLDAMGALFLGLAAPLWICAGLYAQGYLAGKPHARGFCVCWQLTLAGSLGTCVAGDAVAYYVAFSFVSLPAYALVIHERSAESLRAGRIYIALAVFGETSLLLALMLGSHAAASTLMDPIRQALPQAEWGTWAVLALLAGVGMKCGLVPLHGWLPLAHSAAPVPASAVLSGAIVKAGVIGLVRFLPGEGLLADWPLVITWLGLASAYAGVVLGLPQQNPKAVLAYSTMSQMGLLVAVIGAGAGTPGAAAAEATAAAVALLAVHHGLAKGALFLGYGLLGAWAGRGLVLAVLAVLGAAIAGLPLSGGALAKLATKEPLGEGAAALAATWSAVGTMLLMLRFLWLAARQEARSGRPSLWMLLPWVVLVVAALAVPWGLAPRLAPSAVAYALEPASLVDAAWPLLLALALAYAAARWPLNRPQVPVGDVAAWVDARLGTLRERSQAPAVEPGAGDAVAMPALSWMAGAHGAAERLTAWSVAVAALGLLALLLGLVLA
ncbi:complex I subunit 5 family protein [Ramlibacter sp. AN1015]|uniref:complex I subunit 5 family protein n=1 Tax=Ramlibacter sp. AN1015 TaxID=3133428 RepID=UPI0030BFC895